MKKEKIGIRKMYTFLYEMCMTLPSEHIIISTSQQHSVRYTLIGLNLNVKIPKKKIMKLMNH